MIKWKAVAQIQTYSQNNLNKIAVVADSIIIVAGGEKFSSAEILLSHDNGSTWHFNNVAEAGKGLYGLSVAPDQTIFCSGIDGRLVKGNIYNTQWRYLHVEPPSYYVDLAFPEPNRGLMISTAIQEKGSVSITDSNGIISKQHQWATGLNDIEMINPKEGYIAGYGVILKTEDSGNTWQTLDIENDNFTAIHAYGRNEAWTCGANGSIFHTSDGGKSWKRMRNGNDFTQKRYRLSDILFTDPLHGYAVGEKGVVLYSDDGGHHWMEFEKFTDNDLRCIAGKKDGSLFVCGDRGTLYRVFPKHFQ